MRLRVLELPTEIVDSEVRTPFVLVLDRVSTAELEAVGGDNAADNFLEEISSPEIREQTGARGVLFFQYDVELD